MGYRVGSVMYCRPDGVIQRKVAGVSCSTFHRGCCLSLRAPDITARLQSVIGQTYWSFPCFPACRSVFSGVPVRVLAPLVRKNR